MSRGRKPLRGERASCHLRLHLCPGEWISLSTAASYNRQKVVQWAVDVLTDAANEEIEARGALRAAGVFWEDQIRHPCHTASAGSDLDRHRPPQPRRSSA